MSVQGSRLLFRVPEAADVWGISRAKADELIRCHSISHIRVGGSIRVPATALEEWIDKLLREQVKVQ